MSYLLLSEDFDTTDNFASPWVAVNGTWRRFAYQHSGATATALYGGAFFCNATGAYAAPPMGKLVLGQAWHTLLTGDTTADKVGTVEAYVRWRAQADTYTTGAGTFNAQTTYLGLQFLGMSSGISGYAALISRAGGTGVTTLRLVKVSGAYTAPTFTDLGGAAVTLPTASEGDRWKITVTVTILKPTFTLASFSVTVTTASASYSVGMPSALTAAAYAADTGQSGTTWASLLGYVGFLNRPGVPQFAPFTAQGDAVPNQFEELRVRDVGILTTPANATPTYTLTAAPSLTAITASTESQTNGLTLTVQPSFVMTVQDAWQVEEFTSDSGDRVAWPRQTRRRRLWRFNWTALDSSERATLATLVDDAQGQFYAFSWTDPETNTALSIRFTSGVQFSQVGPNTWTASADVEEVLS